MSSAAQVNANRANAQHSTGPVSAAGIENSKYNAIRHGLCSAQIVIKGEDPAAYDALRAANIQQWAPTSELEAMLVEQISQNWWRLERARRIEHKMLDQFGDVEAYSNKAYLALTRQMNTTERAWNRAVKDLQKLRQLTAVDKKEELNRAAIRSFINAQPQIGSVSATPPKPGPVPVPASPNTAPVAALDDQNSPNNSR